MPDVDGFIEDNLALIAAITQVESSGDVFAARFEPNYQYLMDVVSGKPTRCFSAYRPNGFPGVRGVTSAHTEFVQQRTSWGPMQVMGAVAREYGYMGSFAALCGPLGVHYGALHLMRLKARLVAKSAFRESDLIAAYNAGSARMAGGEYVNQVYVDKVNAALVAAA